MKRSLRLFLLLQLLFVPLATGTTILSVTGPSDFPYLLSTTPGNSQILEASWTTTIGFSNVTIAAEIGRSGTAVSAYLTTNIGPTETIANQIAATTLNPATADELDTLFTGLALGPGTYYLVLTGGAATQGVWYASSSPTIQTVPGVAFGTDGFTNDLAGNPNISNPPASIFVSQPLGLKFTVTSSATPEPNSMVLLFSAVVAGICLLRVKRRI